MSIIPQILFVLIFIFFSFIIYRRIKILKRNILLGEKNYESKTKNKTRIKNVLLIALGQKKMFKKIIPAILHTMIYSGFIIINLEVIEILADGILGSHRIFVHFGMPYYNIFISIIEFFVLLVLLSSILFLIRRNILNIKRFKSIEIEGWPKLDANLILTFEIILMIAILFMNASDLILQDSNYEKYPITGEFYFSSKLKFIFSDLSVNQVFLIERFCWWIHVIGILLFAVYITYSKHLHIFLAFPNIYFSKETPKSEIENMPSITNEIKNMMGENTSSEITPPKRFGAKDITDLSWKNLLDAYSCSECGRCTSECPPNITGKKLSPRKIMMDVRDRADEVGKMIDEKKDYTNKSLIGDYISKEELFACTTCNACVEACPLNINPLDIIIECRRYTALEESSSPNEWNSMFQNIETNFSPWKFPVSDRSNWTKEE